MFSYKLRAPVFGSVAENRRRKADVSSFHQLPLQGGPVQKAMVQDLLSFQQRVVAPLMIGIVENTDSSTDTPTHFQQGAIFRRFKREFATSKIALLHLLLPHPRCDTEAYAQLIYAAALQCFQQAMERFLETAQEPRGEEASHESWDHPTLLLLQAIVTLFTLYALYETNPLPRAESMTPEQWLPVGLQNRENSRALYRRAFRRPIRIDAYCFSLVLQLGQWCLREQAQCQRDALQQQQQQHHQKRSMEDTAINDSSTSTRRRKCTCGMVGDAVMVLERLMEHWEFCDYTGPVGLEALAGHQEYTATTVDSVDVINPVPVSTMPKDSLVLPPQEWNDYRSKDVVVCAMKEYTTCLEGVTKGMVVQPTSSRVPQWQHVLSSTLLSNDKESWKDIFSTKVLREATGAQESREGSGILQPLGGNNEDTTSRNALAKKTQQEQDSEAPKHGENLDASRNAPSQETSAESNSSDPPPIAMSHELAPVMKQNLATIFQLIQQREGPQFFQRTPQGDVSVSNTLEEEDVSTLGVGGVSVATGQGRAALEALLSSAAMSKIPNQVLPSNRKYDRERALALPSAMARVERFLQGNERSDGPDSDSEASDMSNLSESEDGDNQGEEETSVATSAAGKQALEALLSRVSGASKKVSRVRQPRNDIARSKKPKKKRSTGAKKRAVVKTDEATAMEMNTDLGSVATASVGPGERALRSLLHLSAPPKPKESRTSPKQNKNVVDDPGIDTDSVTTSSIGPGKHALQNLLRMSVPMPSDTTTSRPKATSIRGNRNKSNQKETTTEKGGPQKVSKRKAPRGKPTDPAKKPKTVSSEQSVGSSVGAGEHALKVLLERSDRKNESEDNDTTMVPSVDDEASSVTNSSVGGGQQALGVLLSKGRTAKR